MNLDKGRGYRLDTEVCTQNQGQDSLLQTSYSFKIKQPAVVIITEQSILKIFTFSFRYQLRVRYFPKDFKELYTRDKVTFFYLFDQVNKDLILNNLYIY